MFRFILRALLGVPVWLLYFALMIPLMLLGFLLVPLALLCRRYTVRMDADRYTRLHFQDRWMWLWDNDEDGIDGLAIRVSYKNPEWVAGKRWSLFRFVFVWSCWRNSVGNARRVPFFGLSIRDPKDMVVYVPPSGLDAMRLTAGFTPFANRWPEYRKLGPYIARYGWAWELRFPWPNLSSAAHIPTEQRRFFWIGWRIAQQDTPTNNVGFAFQPFGKL
jgi:hypothetical protein